MELLNPAHKLKSPSLIKLPPSIKLPRQAFFCTLLPFYFTRNTISSRLAIAPIPKSPHTSFFDWAGII